MRHLVPLCCSLQEQQSAGAPRNMDRKIPETTLFLALYKGTSAFLASQDHDKPLVMHFLISLVIQPPLMNGICCPKEMAESGHWSLASSFLEDPRSQ